MIIIRFRPDSEFLAHVTLSRLTENLTLVACTLAYNLTLVTSDLFNLYRDWFSALWTHAPFVSTGLQNLNGVHIHGDLAPRLLETKV